MKTRKRMLSILLTIILITSHLLMGVTVSADPSENEFSDLLIDETSACEDENEAILESDASPTSGKCGDNVTWSFSNGTLTLSGSGETWSYGTYAQETRAFEGLEDSILSVVISNGITTIGDHLFSNCTSMKTVTFPGSMTRIGSGSFSGCSSLQKVTIPSRVTFVSMFAFSYCKTLEEIVLPASLEQIGVAAFAGCESLKKFEVDSSNAFFTSEKDVLFNKKKTTLVCYPAGKEETSYSVPSSVNQIGSAAFSYCRNLTNITLPDDLTRIQYMAFSDCSSLASLIIPKNVISIENYAFDTPSLKTITFIGAPPELEEENDEVGGGSFYGLKNTTIYYPDTESLWEKYCYSNAFGGENLKWVSRHVEVTNIKLNKKTLDLPFGKNESLKTIFTPKDAYSPVTWKSSVSANASVSSDGTVTAKKVGKTTITATTSDGKYKATCTVQVQFTDVTNKNYAPYTAIYDLNAKGIVAGFSDGTFRPNNSVTRGGVLVFLWRAAGKPEPKTTKLAFKDAAEIKALGTQYEKAVLWGIEKGITEGFTDNTFRPNAYCTRGQIVTFLWRYKGKPAPKSGYSGSFPDVPKSHSFYKAVSWAASYGITTGFSDGTFGPSKTCTRGQCIAFIYRMLNL